MNCSAIKTDGVGITCNIYRGNNKSLDRTYDEYFVYQGATVRVGVLNFRLRVGDTVTGQNLFSNKTMARYCAELMVHMRYALPLETQLFNGV